MAENRPNRPRNFARVTIRPGLGNAVFFSVKGDGAAVVEGKAFGPELALLLAFLLFALTNAATASKARSVIAMPTTGAAIHPAELAGAGKQAVPSQGAATGAGVSVGVGNDDDARPPMASPVPPAVLGVGTAAEIATAAVEEGGRSGVALGESCGEIDAAELIRGIAVGAGGDGLAGTGRGLGAGAMVGGVV